MKTLVRLGFLIAALCLGSTSAKTQILSAGCPIASVINLGCVRPDGTTITIAGGVISSVGGGGGGSPGGLSGQAQYNAGGGIFGGTSGLTLSSGAITGLLGSATDPNAASNPSDYKLGSLTSTYDNAAGLNTGFTDANTLEITNNGNFGLNSYGGGTNAKWTFLPLNIAGNYVAQGQRFALGENVTCWGNGDCFGESKSIAFWGADINGDEGQGFQSVSYLTQGGQNNSAQLTLTTINGVPTATACNTTATQAITGSGAAQTVTVASTAGCSVNDWVVVNAGVPTGAPNYEAVKLTAVNAGVSISGIFRLTQLTGVTITPAKVVPLASTNSVGQGRMLIDESGSSYSTGTVASISGGGFTGSGTTWTNSMVGDNGAPNIGCIELTADAYSGTPFNGTGVHGTLNSWYAVSSVASATSLGIFTNSTAGDAAYHGYGPGAGGYVVRPCAEVLQVVGGSAILTTTAATWTNGDTVEEAITPFPDASGHQEVLAIYAPGGAGGRRAYYIANGGARTFTNGIELASRMQSGGNVDSVAWGNAVSVSGAATGIAMDSTLTQVAMALPSTPHAAISWGALSAGNPANQYVGYASVNGSDALLLHGQNGTGSVADPGTMTLGIESTSPRAWGEYRGPFALEAITVGNYGSRLRFFDVASVAHDPDTATSYVDLKYAYNNCCSYHGIEFDASDTGSPFLKINAGANAITSNATFIEAGPANATALTLSGLSHTGSNALPDILVSSTLNTTGVVPGVLKLAITDTAHGAGTNLIEVLGGSAATTQLFAIDTSGNVIAGSDATAGFQVLHAGTPVTILNSAGQITTIGYNAHSVASDGPFFVNSHSGSDVVLSRQAAANLRLGGSDVAAPTAQTFSVQGVVAGTSNTAGADWTIAGSVGTGSGGGGKIIFQTAAAHGSDTVQDTLTTALTIDKAQAVTLSGAVLAPNLATSSAAATGTWCWTTGTGNTTIDTTLACLSSDERLKSISGGVSGALAEISRLNPIVYRWKPGSPKFRDDPGEHVGLGAFATAYIDERLIARDAKGNPRGWREDAMIALLVRALQEQQDEIMALRAH